MSCTPKKNNNRYKMHWNLGKQKYNKYNFKDSVNSINLKKKLPNYAVDHSK